MSTKERAGDTAAVSSKPGTRKRRATSLRRLAGSGVVATAAGLGLVAFAAGAASAGTLPNNSPTIQLGQYAIPGSAPAYVSGGDLLPEYNGTLGNPAAIVLGTPGGDVTTSSQVVTNGSAAISDPGNAAAQAWYFQRVGYVGLNIPGTFSAGGADMLAAPVYEIINYSGGSYTCMNAAGANVGTAPCDATDTTQLWVVGSANQSNATMNATTGTFDGSSPQVYSSLQGSPSGGTALSDSVIENVADLQVRDWNTAQANVVSTGDTSTTGLSLESQFSSATTPQNSTWNILPAGDLPTNPSPPSPPSDPQSVFAMPPLGPYGGL